MENRTQEHKIKFFSTSIGFLFVIISGAYALLQITQCPWIHSNLSWTYISLSILSIATALLLYGIHPNKLSKRREVEVSELENLYAEVRRCRNEEDLKCTNTAQQEVERLKELHKKLGHVYELDVLSLRLALVDLYPESELATKTNYELELLDENMDTKAEERILEALEDKINGIIHKCEDESISEEKKPYKKLRAELKILREKVADYDKAWAIGELIRNGISYWTTLSVIAFLLMGLLPIIHKDGSDILGILSWGLFGLSGALLSVLFSISGAEVIEIGEQAGKQLLIRTVASIAIGTTTAILLHAALKGGILGGTMFPDFKKYPASEEAGKSIYNGLSIFWGFFAGFSLRIFASLAELAESAFGKEETK